MFSSERPGSLYVIPSKYETAEAFKEQHVSYYKQQTYTEGTKPPRKKYQLRHKETKKRKVRADKGKKRGCYNMRGYYKKNYTLPCKMNPLSK